MASRPATRSTVMLWSAVDSAWNWVTPVVFSQKTKVFPASTAFFFFCSVRVCIVRTFFTIGFPPFAQFPKQNLVLVFPTVRKILKRLAHHPCEECQPWKIVGFDRPEAATTGTARLLIASSQLGCQRNRKFQMAQIETDTLMLRYIKSCSVGILFPPLEFSSAIFSCSH